MQTKDFYFDLPEELIAQTPSEIRGQDKLLVMDRVSGKVEHHQMQDLIDLIDENTLMAFNNSAPFSVGKILKYTFAIDKSVVMFTFETVIIKFESPFLRTSPCNISTRSACSKAPIFFCLFVSSRP